MSIKMKGLLKGLRYISQIFEEEEEEKEMQIGFPTDVKHVAHIGWDGPSVNSPSWMNDFKSSAPENGSSNGDANRDAEEVEWVSQDSTTKKSVKDSSSRDLPTIPKSSRRQPSVDSIGSTDSPLGSPTQKNKSSRRRSKQKESSNNNSPRGGESSNSQGLPNIPKKTRRKKSKDSGDGSVKSSSSKSKDKSSKHGSKHGSDDGSITNHYSDEVAPNLGSLKENEVKE
ncbi:hypothetical protein vseg_013411 [Gypsophila vaccaria]